MAFGLIVVVIVGVVIGLIVLAAHALDLVRELLYAILDGIVDLVVILDGRGSSYQDVSEYSCRQQHGQCPQAQAQSRRPSGSMCLDLQVRNIGIEGQCRMIKTVGDSGKVGSKVRRGDQWRRVPLSPARNDSVVCAAE